MHTATNIQIKVSIDSLSQKKTEMFVLFSSTNI